MSPALAKAGGSRWW